MPSRSDAESIFAANRAVGGVALSVVSDRGVTRRKRVAEHGSLRARFPNGDPREPELVLVNTAGGIAGGDRFDIALDIGADARLVVTTAAAEKVYRAIGAESAIAVKASVGPGAALTWVPQETILFDRVRLRRRIDIDLAEGASLLLAEAVVFGRSAMNERVEQGSLLDSWRVRRAGRLVFADAIGLAGPIREKLDAPAAGRGAAAIATVLLVPGDEIKVAASRPIAETFVGEVGISAWNGIAVARFCARDGETLRRDMMALLAVWQDGPLPRLWLN